MTFKTSQHSPICERPQLYSRLSFDAPVITITAGTGFGKSCTVSSWLEYSATTPLQMTLTAMDNYKHHFWKSFSSAVTQGNKVLQDELLHNGFPEDYNTYFHFLKIFTERIYHFEDSTLILDNYHHIKNADIQYFIESLILSNIESLKFIIISRSEVDLHNLSHFGVNVSRLTEKDLHFTEEEMQNYYRQHYVNLASHEFHKLFQYTKGWPLSISIAMNVFKQKANREDTEGLVELFKNDTFSILESRMAHAYTSQELRKISLLALLDFFPSKLAEKILGSSAFFDRVSVDLLVCADSHKNIYQFHEVFRSYFYDYAQHNCQDLLRHTYITAGAWFAGHGYSITALTLYRKASSYSQCLDVIKDMVPQRFSSETGEMLIQTIEEFPADFKEQHPIAEVIYAVVHFWTPAFTNVAHLLEEFIDKYENVILSPAAKEALCDAYISLGLFYMLSGDTQYKEYFKRAMELFSEESVIFGKNFLLLNDGRSITLKSEKPGEMKNWVIALYQSDHYLHTLLNCGHGYSDLAYAESAYFQGDMDDALLYVHLALDQSRKHKQLDIICSCYALLNKIAVAQGSYADSRKALESMVEYLAPLNLPPSFHLPDIAQSWFYIKLGDLTNVISWNSRETLFSHSKFLITIGIKSSLYAECLLAEERYEEMLQEVLSIEKTFTAMNLVLPLITAQILKAIAYHKLDRYAESTDALVSVHRLASPNNIILPVIEYGKDILPILKYAKEAETGLPTDWLDLLETKAAIYKKNISQVREDYTAANELPENKVSLNALEQSLLCSLGNGLSIKEIADLKKLPPSYIRTLLNQIYLKLGAVNAAHAVRLAYIKHLI